MSVIHLTYHYVRNGPAPAAVCTPARFGAQLEKIKREGATVLKIGEVARRMRDGVALPEKCVTLSFDDGLRDGYDTALPMLRKFGFPATFFVITDTLRGNVPGVIALQALIAKAGARAVQHEILPQFLPEPYRSMLDPKRLDIGTWYGNEAPEVRRIKTIMNMIMPHYLKEEMVRRIWVTMYGASEYQKLLASYFITRRECDSLLWEWGMEVGSHSVTHPKFSSLSKYEIARECKESSQHLTGRHDPFPAVFCYPFGGTVDAETQKIVAESAQYVGACNYDFGQPLGHDAGGLYNLRRVDESTFNP